jgi:serine/threonine-protein kinase
LAGPKEPPVALASPDARVPTARATVADAGAVPADAAAARLAPDARVEAERGLERPVRYGKIHVYAEPWAYIYFRGRRVGETPKRGLRLPVGRHRLELVNPVQKRKTRIWVDVPREEPYQVALP